MINVLVNLHKKVLFFSRIFIYTYFILQQHFVAVNKKSTIC